MSAVCSTYGSTKNSLVQTVDGRIVRVRCGIISSYQSAATSDIVKRKALLVTTHESECLNVRAL